MKRDALLRWSYFLGLLTWGFGYIALFGFFLSSSEDHIAGRRRDVICGRDGSLIATEFGFGSAVVDRNMIAAGWSGPEHWGVWSAERRARLVLPVPSDVRGDALLELDLLAPTNPKFPLAEVDVSSDGRRLAHLEMREGVNKDGSHRIAIPRDLTVGRTCIELELRFPHAFRPSKNRLGSDSRLLGIGLRAARWIAPGSN